MIKSIEDIIWKAGKKVNDEPRLEIVDSDDRWVTNHFSTWSNIGCVEVEDNVNEEYYIHNGVHYQQTDIL